MESWKFWGVQLFFVGCLFVGGLVLAYLPGIFGRVRVLAGFGCFILHTFAGVSMHGTMHEHIHVRLGGFWSLTVLAGLFLFDRALALDQLA